MERTCNGCTACCTHVKVDAFKKPKGVPCKHECATGCNIHGEHPDECKLYSCAWLEGIFGDDCRPADCGWMGETAWIEHPRGRLDVVFLWDCKPGSIEKDQDKISAGARKRRVIFDGDALHAYDEEDASDFMDFLAAVKQQGYVTGNFADKQQVIQID